MQGKNNKSYRFISEITWGSLLVVFKALSLKFCVGQTIYTPKLKVWLLVFVVDSLPETQDFVNAAVMFLNSFVDSGATSSLYL